MTRVENKLMDTLVVRQITPSGPAEDAGLQPGTVLFLDTIFPTILGWPGLVWATGNFK